MGLTSFQLKVALLGRGFREFRSLNQVVERRSQSLLYWFLFRQHYKMGPKNRYGCYGDRSGPSR